MNWSCEKLWCAARAAPVPRQAVEKTPAIGEFKLLASRRFVLDNEVKLAELVPGTVMAPGVQHPLVWSVDVTPPQVAFEDGTMRLSAVGRIGALQARGYTTRRAARSWTSAGVSS